MESVTAIRNYSNNNTELSKVMQKLSSGLKINGASDNAAGLAITEKMKSRIRGLEQASRNIMDGMNLINTAEGALAEITGGILPRVRELTLQAMNDTLTDNDRQVIQNEVDELIRGMSDIAEQTQFNEIELLRPEITFNPPELKSGKADIVFVIDVTGSMGGPINNVVKNLDRFVGTLQAQGVDIQLGLVLYGDVNYGENTEKKDFTVDIDAFKEDLDHIKVSGGWDWPESGLEGLMDPDNGALSFEYRQDASKQVILLTDAAVHNGPPMSEYTIDQTIEAFKNKGIQTSVVGPLGQGVYEQLEGLITGTNGLYFDINNEQFGDQLEVLADKIVVDSKPDEADEMAHLKLQIGADQGDIFILELMDCRPKELGIDDLDVTSLEACNETLSKVDRVLNQLLAYRGRLGAYTNALEHTGSNGDNYIENLQSAQSRISDADMAQEIIQLSRFQVLLTSAGEMIKQSQQKQEQLLQLLQ